MRIHAIYRPILKLWALIAILCTNSGFAPIFSTGAILPSTIENPEVTFVWDGSHPGFKKKDKFRDGIYAETTDHDLMMILLQEAALIWSNVPGSYLKLAVEENADSARLEPTDQINSIITSPTGSLSAAASANPVSDDAFSEIIDCDIIMGPERKEVEFVLYALVHELGHCIGLGHSHDNYHAIMSYSRASRKAVLGADDKAGVIFLYRDPSYGEPEVKDAVPITCGVIGPNASSSAGSMFWIMFLPLFYIAARRMVKSHRQSTLNLAFRAN